MKRGMKDRERSRLIYIPLHTMRHNKQIAEVKATPGYPHETGG